MCPRPCRRWTWTATRCRLYVHLSLPSSVRARAHLFCLARAGRRGAAPRVNLGPGFPPFRCRTLVPSHPRRASSRPASASPSRRFTTSTTGTSSFASSFRHLFRRGARSVTTRRSQFWPRGTDRLVAAAGVRPRVRGRRFSHDDGRLGRGCAQTVRRDWWWRRRLESHDGLPRRLHQMLAARAGPLQPRRADVTLAYSLISRIFFFSLSLACLPLAYACCFILTLAMHLPPKIRRWFRSPRSASAAGTDTPLDGVCANQRALSGGVTVSRVSFGSLARSAHPDASDPCYLWHA